MRARKLYEMGASSLLWATLACGTASEAPGAQAPSSPPEPSEPAAEVAPEPSPQVEPAPVGAACTEAGQCESGVCEGEGCGPESSGTCVAVARPCTKDLRPYCGCDGQTFQASGSCPGARYSQRAPCESPATP